MMQEFARPNTRWGPRNTFKLACNDRVWVDVMQVTDGRMKVRDTAVTSSYTLSYPPPNHRC